MTRLTRKARVFWPLLLGVLLTDCTTKRAAVAVLDPPGSPHEVLGETVRFTLGYNDDGAMGIPLGPHGKEILGGMSLLVAVLLYLAYRRSRSEASWAAAGSAVLIAGAVGNGWERLWASRGVVDFIDLGIGSWRFYTFNVADIAIFVGAGLLVLAATYDERAVSGSTESRAPTLDGSAPCP